MKLINNRFKIKELIVTEEYEEGFLVLDLSNNNKKSMLKLYDFEKNANVIKYYIENFIEISQIRHKNLLDSYSFNLVESINLKKTNIPLYYTVAEYIERPVFRSSELTLNLEETLKIILDLMSVIDFLHFRGYVYQYLNPITTFYSIDKSVKIVDLSTISEYKINSYYDDSIEGFTAPETFIDINNADRKADYYSLGMMMKYLLMEDHLKVSVDYKYKDHLHLTSEHINFLNNVINNLTNKDPSLRDVNLRTHIDSIINFFELNYAYDLVKERSNFYSKTKIVGRDSELQKLLSINSKYTRENKNYGLAIISGNEGDGKTKLLNELSYKLKMTGKDVYFIDAKENSISGSSNMVSLIKETFKNTSNDILNRYSEDFSFLLPELVDKKDNKNLNSEAEKFKSLNRLGNYFKEIAKGNKIFIIIDNFNKITDDFISVLDYIINNTDNNEISIIIGFETNYTIDNLQIYKAINRWKSYNTVIEIKLEKLNEEEIGKLTKSILGISYIPKRFSSILYKGSQGNPLYLDYIIKYLYNKGELYINNKGNWGLKTEDYSTLPIPSNINKAIEEQLNKIKDEDLIVLKVISIFTDKFTKKLLVKILNIDSISIDIYLSKLIEERFVEKYDDSSYSIIKNGWQRIVYSRISTEEKESLHSKAAEILIEYGENTQLTYEEIICHLVKANNDQNSIRFISNEWDKLDNKYGDESIYLCEEAYKLVKDRHDEIKLVFLDRLVDIYSIKGNIEKSEKYLEELTYESNLQNNIEFQIKAMTYKAANYFKENNAERAYELALKIEDVSRVHSKHEGIIESLIMKCRIVLDNKELSYIENLLNEALELSNIYKNEKYLGTIYNLLGLANHMNGNTETAISNYMNSIEHSINSNNMLEATKPMNNLAEIYSLNHGNIDMALYYYKRGLEIANSYGFTQPSIIFLNNLGELYKNSGDMHKALELFEESLKGAIKIGDYKMIFLANVNLGSLYLTYNMMGKAYKCFNFLEKEHKANPILEIEILIQYYMFLGEYYEDFGEFDLAVDYFLKVAELCKGHNIRDYLRAKIKLILINYVQKVIISEFEVNSLIEELHDAKLFYDQQSFLLYLSILLHSNKEEVFRNKLLEIYDSDKNILSDPTLVDLRKFLGFLIEDTLESLGNIEKFVERNQNLKLKNTHLYIYVALGKTYFSKRNYQKSTKYFLKTLDSLYTIAKNIPQESLSDKFVRARSSESIKGYIIEGLNNIINEKLTYKLDNHYELSQLINWLPDNVISNIFHNEIKVKNMGSVEELISNLSEDCDKNIDFILDYIGLITLADRGHILKFDENTNDYISISSLVEGDTEIPNESILIQSNKSKLGLLLNKNLEDMDKSEYYHYLSSDSVGIICLPINIPYKSKEIIKDRRKRVYSSNQYNKGYIYLESHGALNRFDLERLKLINSLSYLIYLNIENNNLKLISSVDKLTGAFTRKYFEQKLVEILKNLNRTNESFTILMLDIDNFKSVNDTYGHIKGDEVLSQVAKTIKNSIRNTDLVGRYGGEEFIILLSDSTFTLGKNIAEKIRLNIENMKIAEINRTITVSIGISQYPNHSQFKEELINKADQALYYSKNFLGKNSSSIWNIEMGYSYNRIDKLAGVLTGNTNVDNRNLLTILDMVDLGVAPKTFKEKAHLFLGRTLDTIDGEYATLLLLENDETPIPYGSRIRLNTQWVETPIINMDKIRSIIKKREGEYFIDWDDIENVCSITGVPNWQSIIIIPLINMDVIKGVLYITVPLDEKEFDFNSFNLTKLLCNIFSSNL